MTPDDRLAVIGMACRVPGAPSTGDFWRNLVGEVDSVRRYRPEEVRGTGVPASVLSDPAYVPACGHLDGLTDFDADFFKYSTAEATIIDPQQRLLLEVAHAAVEDAGYDPTRSNATFAVFTGTAANRYFLFHLLGNPAALPDGVTPLTRVDWEEAIPGTPPDFAPMRVAYELGMTGPAIAVQTACSSSLVAVCQAAQSLLDYRCDVAVVGGAAVIDTQQAGYRCRPGGLLSPTGRCRPFDATADGMVFGNGAAAVVLKRFDDAISDGDHIDAVIRGWAVTNDGALRAGFLAPGVEGQAAAVVEALACADVQPDTIGMVEAHASSTVAGDAIEVEALRRAYQRSTDRTGFCALGSAKGNLGSLDAAAGVIGLVKAVLAVREAVIPASPHYRTPHPDGGLSGSPFYVPVNAQPWPEFADAPRRAAVSSFGLGGTNAHVIVEQSPASSRAPGADSPQLLPLCAARASALSLLADRLADHLTNPADPPSLHDVAFTLAVGRRPLPYRAAVVCRSLDDAVALLRRINAGSVVCGPGDDSLRALGERWVSGSGAPADLAAVWQDRPGRRVSLPTYPFQRQRCWLEPVRD